MSTNTVAKNVMSTDSVAKNYFVVAKPVAKKIESTGSVAIVAKHSSYRK